MSISNEELARRVQSVEKDVELLRRADDELRQTLSELNKTLALLNHSLKDLQVREEARRSTVNKIVVLVVGTFVTAFMAWVLKGGLA